MKKILILLYFMLVGCASNIMVYESQTGLPVKNYELTISSTYGMKTMFHIVQSKEVSKESSIPVYLNLYETYSLDSDNTKKVEMVIRVYNPKKEKYRIYKEVKHRPPFSWNYQESKSDIYYGNDLDKTFQLVCPVDKGNYIVSAVVLSEDNIPLSVYQDFKYVIK